ncbi:MAG: hypothetical protein EBS68_01980 [Rhodobacteraceae bacterium]|jgi:hypothetical protein|nr:hypothetical protein [Paracoccaceae bacterium]
MVVQEQETMVLKYQLVEMEVPHIGVVVVEEQQYKLLLLLLVLMVFLMGQEVVVVLPSTQLQVLMEELELLGSFT